MISPRGSNQINGNDLFKIYFNDFIPGFDCNLQTICDQDLEQTSVNEHMSLFVFVYVFFNMHMA